LEWVAKWANLGITIEGAGKDHNSKGGSRDVAVACLSSIFGKPAPLNIPYEFFLVEGAKMSSSRGIGVTAREMADFLPPEILRFLMLRSQPNRPINFSPSAEAITKLFNESDRCQAANSQSNASPEIVRVRQFSQVSADLNVADVNHNIPGFQLVQALVQLPHLDVIEEVQKRNDKPLTALELEHLQRRIASVKFWLQNYAEDSERLELQTTLPEAALALSAAQKDFLQSLAVALKEAEWDGTALQTLIFTTAKLIPIPQPEAFSAIYTALFGRLQGPRAGPLFSYMDREFLIQRFSELA
jgi:lysyl-tRNA synthetase class 1